MAYTTIQPPKKPPKRPIELQLSPDAVNDFITLTIKEIMSFRAMGLVNEKHLLKTEEQKLSPENQEKIKSIRLEWIEKMHGNAITKLEANKKRADELDKDKEYEGWRTLTLLVSQDWDTISHEKRIAFLQARHCCKDTAATGKPLPSPVLVQQPKIQAPAAVPIPKPKKPDEAAQPKPITSAPKTKPPIPEDIAPAPARSLHEAAQPKPIIPEPILTVASKKPQLSRDAVNDLASLTSSEFDTLHEGKGRFYLLDTEKSLSKERQQQITGTRIKWIKLTNEKEYEEPLTLARCWDNFSGAVERTRWLYDVGFCQESDAVVAPLKASHDDLTPDIQLAPVSAATSAPQKSHFSISISRFFSRFKNQDKSDLGKENNMQLEANAAPELQDIQRAISGIIGNFLHQFHMSLPESGRCHMLQLASEIYGVTNKEDLTKKLNATLTTITSLPFDNNDTKNNLISVIQQCIELTLPAPIPRDNTNSGFSFPHS